MVPIGSGHANVSKKNRDVMSTLKKPSALTFDVQAAKNQLEEMHAQISKASTSTLLWYFNKTMRSAVRGLFVDMNGIERVKNLIKGNKTVIFVPLYKSYGDFFVMQFVNYTFGIEPGFTFGNLEDTPRIGGFKTGNGECFYQVAGWVEGAGYIYARRNEGQSL